MPSFCFFSSLPLGFPEATFGLSQRGGVTLLLGGDAFNKGSCTNNTTRWLCPKNKSAKYRCRANATTCSVKGVNVIIATHLVHNH